MDVPAAAALIAPAIRTGERWADLGAGDGTFTAALGRLVGSAGAVYAIERDASRVRSLEQLARSRSNERDATIIVVHGDFTEPLDLPPLDGALLANALHYVAAPAQAATLRRTAAHINPTGSVVVIEYDNRPPSRWVPYPISRARLAVLARDAGLGAPELLGERKSLYGGHMYGARLAVHGNSPRPTPHS
jgi:ubiquinone/menaquinone biosynthesis C-methylase UbiE